MSYVTKKFGESPSTWNGADDVVSRLLESQFSTLYWMMQCRQELSAMIGRERHWATNTTDVREALLNHFDEITVSILEQNSVTVTLDVYVELSNKVFDHIVALDREDRLDEFNKLEDVMFYVGEFTRGLQRIGLTIDLLFESWAMEQDEEEEIVDSLYAKIGSELGFVIE